MSVEGLALAVSIIALSASLITLYQALRMTRPPKNRKQR